MRTPLIAGNWKMNCSVEEALRLLDEMLPRLSAIQGVEKVVCPPFVALAPLARALEGADVKLGAQNCYFEPKGAFTGEISPAMLAPLCQYVILGHSERRAIFGEDDALVSRKVRAALAHGLSVILCVGENLAEHQAGRTADVVINQLQASLEDVLGLDRVVIAYEPVWAIGTGQPATGHQANHVAATLRSVLRGLYGPETAERTRILYGGSVIAANASEFVDQPEIDGALVGGASLKPDEFVGIVNKAAVRLAPQ
ncbi:MAG: triose-phosphate isomerase [Bacteroidetes bacterium]|nr:triose-phosphate isomerase [Bacteroidota bacterium]MCL5026843.1 triose-phosphate isomerase [Chloroflexota bacterium]